jgi:tetratricopeptide (TPR) repeat protein
MGTVENKDMDKGYPMQNYEVLQYLGDCYACVGNFASAQDCYEQAAALGPEEAGPYVGLGVIALQKDMLDDAEAAFSIATRLDKNGSKAYTGLAMVLQRKGGYQQAFDMYLKSLDLDSDNLTALLGLFQTSCYMGSFSKVIFYLETYLNIHPGDTAVMFTLAALYVKDGKMGKAKQVLINILALDSSNADAVKLLEEVEHQLEGACVGQK